MTKEKLIEKIKAILETDADLDFLRRLKKEELEKLLASIRWAAERTWCHLGKRSQLVVRRSDFT